MKLLLTAAAVFAFLLASAAAGAADVIRVEISAVEEREGRIVAAVTAFGSDGKPLQDLLSANFRASLDDRPLSISDVQTANGARAGASVVLLVDVSGSMAGDPMTQAKRALQEFVRGLEPADQVAILAFDDTVHPIQDYTTSRSVLDQAVAKLAPAGDTALYDAVLEGTRKALEAPAGRRLIVLLSDGQATVGLGKRTESIAAAERSGVGFVSVGLGNAVDRAYINELTGATSGRAIDTASAASLRQTYVDIAAAIRSQYTLTMIVPPDIDRSLPGKLSLRVTSRENAGLANRTLVPLAGAVPPPFDLTLTGIPPKGKLTGTTSLLPGAPATLQLASVDYQVDGTSVFSSSAAPYSFDLNPEAFAPGSHLLTVLAVDQRGRQGKTQVAFSVTAPVAASSGGGVDVFGILPIVLAVIVLGGTGVYVVRKRQVNSPAAVAGRIAPFAVRVTEPTGPVEGWPIQAVERRPVRPENAPLGQIVLLDEQAIRSGTLDTIREFEIGTAPLTLGTGHACDIQIEDPEGRIAAEEARLWVQKGRLVYHKLTTLSAMATEGVTTGWQILDSGDDIPVGPYRLLFQELVMIEEPEDEPRPEPQRLPPDEESYFKELWTRVPDDPPLHAAE